MSTRQQFVRLTVSLVIWLVAALTYTHATDTTTLDAEKAAAIDRLLEPWSAPDSPGAAVAVVRGEQIVFARGYGSADLENGIPIEPGTLFDAASIAKTFTGLGVALLIATGEVDLRELDVDVRESIDEVRRLPSKITLRHLLYHTSGLRDWPGGIVLGGGRFEDRIDFERVLRFIDGQRALNSPPGQRYSYTNSGYVLLARWIELRTGETYPSWMHDAIFAPLGMENTVIPREPGVPMAGSATGHRKVDGQWRRLPRNCAVWGSSSMWTSALDLGRFMIELGRRDALKPLAFQLMEQPGRTRGGDELNYGAGVQIGTQDGRRHLGHTGRWSGFRPAWRWFPAEKVGVCVLSNADQFDPGKFVDGIAEIVLTDGVEPTREESVIELTQQQRARLIGRYRVRVGFDIQIFEVHGKLHARATGQDLFPLITRSPSELNNESGSIRFVFELPRSGEAKGLISHQHGDRTPAPRVEIEDGPAPEITDPEELRLVTGRYPLWPHKHVEFRIEDDALVAQGTGEASHPVQRLTRDRFFVEAYGAETRFRRDAQGRATGLTYRGLDTRRLADVDPETLAPYAGIYRSAELSTEYRIAVTPNGLVAEHPRHGTIELSLMEDNRFQGTPWYFRDLVFEGRGAEPRSRFRLTISRLENVVFERVEGVALDP